MAMRVLFGPPESLRNHAKRLNFSEMCLHLDFNLSLQHKGSWSEGVGTLVSSFFILMQALNLNKAVYFWLNPLAFALQSTNPKL